MKRRDFGLYLGVMAAVCAAGVLWAADAPPAGVVGASKATLTFMPMPPTMPVVSMNEVLAMYGTKGHMGRGYTDLTASHNTLDLTIAGTDVSLAWSAPSNFALKANGTTVPVQYNAATGGLTPVSVTVNKTQKYVLAFPRVISVAGANKGVEVSYRSGAVQKGTINGQTITLFDENVDGVYTMDDSIRVDTGGSLAVFTPISKYLSTKSGVVEITDIASDGSSLSYVPYSGKTGKMSWNPMLDPKVEVHAVFGSKASGLNLEVCSHGSSVDATAVPGDYEFMYGMMYSPSLNKIAAHIVPKTGGTLTVSEGATVKSEWGKPFSFEFAATKKGGKIDINPLSIHIRGKGTEEYKDVVYEALPEVFLVADGKAVSMGRMAFG